MTPVTDTGITFEVREESADFNPEAIVYRPVFAHPASGETWTPDGVHTTRGDAEGCARIWIERVLVPLPAPAVFSPCRTWRYVLRRRFLVGEGAVNFVMLNPSTATETVDDPTIRRCIGYAQRWGYRELVVTNLFAYRSTDPRALGRVPDPVGPENDRHLVEQARAARLVVCAWGAHGTRLDRGETVRRLLTQAGVPLHHLALTLGGYPGHPLYLPADREPQPWQP